MSSAPCSLLSQSRQRAKLGSKRRVFAAATLEIDPGSLLQQPRQSTPAADFARVQGSWKHTSPHPLREDGGQRFQLRLCNSARGWIEDEGEEKDKGEEEEEEKEEEKVLCRPVAVDAAGVDVVGALDAADGLQADAGGLERHDVDQAVLELVAGQVGTDEARRVSFGVGQSLFGER